MGDKLSEKRSIHLDVNGEGYQADVYSSETLLETLRGKLGLTGAKPGCLNGDCGACTVIVGKQPMKSCLMLSVEAIGHRITTIEGLKDTPIQKAFIKHFAFQCGYCTPGFIMNSHALLSNYSEPAYEQIEEWLQSNICRCTGYEEIEKAILSVIDERRNTKL